MTRAKMEGLRAMDRIIDQDREQLARMREVMEHPGHAISSGSGSGFREGDRIGDAVARLNELQDRIDRELLMFQAQRAEIYDFCMSIDDLWMRSIVVWRCVNLWTWRKIGAKANIGEEAAKAAYYRWCRKNLEK